MPIHVVQARDPATITIWTTTTANPLVPMETVLTEDAAYRLALNIMIEVDRARQYKAAEERLKAREERAAVSR